MPGGVYASLGWLREHLAKTGRALLPEQIILAGTPLDLYPVRLAIALSFVSTTRLELNVRLYDVAFGLRLFLPCGDNHAISPFGSRMRSDHVTAGMR